MEKKQEIEYFIDKSKSFRKSVILFQMKGNVASPLLYINKPKHINEEEFNKILDRIQIYIKPE